MIFISYKVTMRIALIGENSEEYIKQLLLIWRNENSAVLIDWRMPISTISVLLKKYNVNKCIIDKKLEGNGMEKICASVEYFETLDEKINLVKEETKKMYVPNFSKKEALLLFSSGTTGIEKGILLSFYAINLNAQMILKQMKPVRSDCIYISKILAHSSTLIGELLVGLMSEMKIVVSSVNLSIRSMIDNIQKHKVTMLCTNPTLLRIITDYIKVNDVIIKDLHKVYCSGAVLNPALQNEFENLVPQCKTYNMYGLTEAGPRVSMQNEEHKTKGSVGVCLDGIEIKIVDENFGEKKIGEVGKIMVHTPCQCLNLATLTGWLDTKDIGYVNENRELFVLGRGDEVINKGSYNIIPSGVQDIIIENTDVDDCYVFGITDHLYGEKICCIYEGKLVNEEYKKTIREKCRLLLLPYEVPDVFVYGKVFRNRNGKVDRKKIKEYYKF